MKNCEYVAIKVKGLPNWLWFKTKNISETDSIFEGVDGWGKGGEYTEITIHKDEIIGRIHSNTISY